MFDPQNIFIKKLAFFTLSLIMLTACSTRDNFGDGFSNNNSSNDSNVNDNGIIYASNIDDSDNDSQTYDDFPCVTDEDSPSRTDEYKRTRGLDAICASYAYDAGYSGKGQTVAVLEFEKVYDHAEFTDDDGNSAFITGDGARSPCNINGCGGGHITVVTATAAARKNTINDGDGEPHPNNMHGVAYDSDIVILSSVGSLINGVFDNVISMNNSWTDGVKATCFSYKKPDGTFENVYLKRNPGVRFGNKDCSSTGDSTPSALTLSRWKQITDRGTIVVFANGNDSLNSENGRIRIYRNADFSDEGEVLKASDLFGADHADMPNYTAMYPEYESALRGKWLTVIAVGSDKKITSYSNGCGAAKDYCIAAPGYVYAAGRSFGDTNLWSNVNGTSQAAPYVTGAIAVVKSAYPSLSSEEITDIILTSADDLGAKGTDNVYGRGMLNLRAAIQPIGELNAVTTNNQSLDVLMDDTSLTLASHFGTQIHEVEIGMRDNYNRTFIASPTKFDRVPITSSLDDYMQNFTSNSQTETYALTPQTSLNYQSDENQTWMHLVYDYGNATASIAFYDNLQPKLLPQILIGDESYAPILRAFAIRPAGEDIAQMNVSHQLNSRVTLSSYAAKGNYDTGHDFNELGTDINYKTDRLTLNIGMGHLREYQQFLGTEGTGAYALDGASLSQFSDIHISHKLHKNSRFSLFAHYALYETKVDMRYQQFAEIQDLQADHSAIGITGADIISEGDNLTISFNTALGVTDGALVQHTVLGYNDDGEYNNVSNRYDLAVENRHQQIAMVYQGRLENQGERNMPLFSHNRFFTTISYDNHYQHQQGLTQISIISGISAEF